MVETQPSRVGDIVVPLEALRARRRDGALGDALVYGPLAPVADGTTGLPLLHLVPNHELSPAPAFALSLAYDPAPGGGTTTVAAWLATSAPASVPAPHSAPMAVGCS